MARWSRIDHSPRHALGGATREGGQRRPQTSGEATAVREALEIFSRVLLREERCDSSSLRRLE